MVKKQPVSTFGGGGHDQNPLGELWLTSAAQRNIGDAPHKSINEICTSSRSGLMRVVCKKGQNIINVETETIDAPLIPGTSIFKDEFTSSDICTRGRNRLIAIAGLFDRLIDRFIGHSLKVAQWEPCNISICIVPTLKSMTFATPRTPHVPCTKLPSAQNIDNCHV